MRAAAQLRRKISDLDHAHLVAVFLTEQRHGVILVDGHVNRNVLDNLDALVAQDLFINEVFDILQFFFGDSSEVRKVKTQMIGSDQRSRLLYVLA